MLFRKITIRDNRKLSGGRSLAWTRTSACHADDPGSNPGGRTSKLPPFGESSFFGLLYSSVFGTVPGPS